MDNRGINGDDVKKQIVTLEYYIDEIKTSLDNMSMYFSTLKDSYSGAGRDAINAKYDKLSASYIDVYNKLGSYCERLDDVIINYQLKDKEISSYLDSKN